MVAGPRRPPNAHRRPVFAKNRHLAPIGNCCDSIAYSTDKHEEGMRALILGSIQPQDDRPEGDATPEIRIYLPDDSGGYDQHLFPRFGFSAQVDSSCLRSTSASSHFKYVPRFMRVHACTVTPQTEAATQLIAHNRRLHVLSEAMSHFPEIHRNFFLWASVIPV